MALLQWDDGFETGIAAADHEHGKMIDLVNTVHARWLRDGGGDVAKLFDGLGEVFSSHFHFEDQIMQGSDYPDKDAHVRDHDRILAELRRIRARAEGPGYDVMAALRQCLQPWLAAHIKNHDAPLYRDLASAS